MYPQSPPEIATPPTPSPGQPSPGQPSPTGWPLPATGSPTGPFGAPLPASGSPAVVPPALPVAEPTRRGWVPMVATAATAAVLASAATAGLVLGLGGERTADVSLATLGTTSTVAAAPGSASGDPDWAVVAEAVRPSVVAIQLSVARGTAEGSGVIVDTDGNILTNNHVVADAQRGSLTVTLADGRVFDATVVGTDPTTDLAVIALTDPPDDLVPAALGDSDAVTVGEAVMAVGNPLGLSSTVTTGIVSALDRPVSTSDGGSTVVTNAIQIDAAVNPGNSGGPLFNASGEVIGITSSIATTSSSSGSIGLGFAIPANLADRVGAELLADGTADHAFLGVTLSDGTATADGVTRRGAVVEQVTAGSPADDAGLVAGDVIVAIGENPVNGAESLTGHVRALASGQSATLTVVRDGGAFTVEVTFAALDTTDTGSQQESPSLPSLPWGQGG